MTGSNGTKPDQTEREWLTLDEACAYTQRSLAAVKHWVNQGKIKKRLVPKPKARPRVELWREDLDRLVAPVHVPTVEVAKPDQTEALMPAAPTVVTHGMEAALSRLAEIFGQVAHVRLEDKLCWTLAEARTMTGLSLPALRELVEAHPEVAIRRGRRMWIKAAGLRAELS